MIWIPVIFFLALVFCYTHWTKKEPRDYSEPFYYDITDDPRD